MSELSDLLDNILVEDILDREGFDYRFTHGSRGEQLNVQECPFCGGSDYKVYINRESGLGNCFHGSCQERFNTYTLTQKILDNAGAGRVVPYLKQLAEEQGWRPKSTKSAIEIETYEGEWKLPANINLPDKHGNMLEYLTKRGVTPEIAKMFDLRYCNDAWFNYTKPDGSRGGMNFGGRVLFPIYDLNAEMVTFQGRDITGKSDRKYLFPPKLPGTSSFFYNGFRCMRKETVVMCEGVMDVIGAYMALRETKPELGVMGSFGISLSSGRSDEDQIARLLQMKRKGLKRIIIMWDGERGAYAAALEAAAKIVKLGIKVSIALLPKGKDPGDADAREIIDAVEGAQKFGGANSLRLGLRNPYRQVSND